MTTTDGENTRTGGAKRELAAIEREREKEREREINTIRRIVAGDDVSALPLLILFIGHRVMLDVGE